ncbi:MAG TPA: hypothetical protein VEH26_00290 [Chthoniobacterales bacterium]|nr:hypothetical protein [Chthoniobacterales bacterium]
MKISQDDLRQAAAVSGLSVNQADSLWQSLESIARDGGKPKFDLANVAYYFGALIVIGAMGWFMNRGWESLGGLGIAIIAVCYAISFILVGRILWKKQNLRIPGGLLFTMAVCMAPLATYGVERWLGLWPAGDPGSYTNFHPLINGSWIAMEAVTIVAGFVALRFWRFPFLTAPIAYALWFMSMDLADLMVGHRVEWNEKATISMAFGAAMIIAAYAADLKGKVMDFAFWGYLFGLMSFWGGLTAMESHSELGKFIYCLINLALVFCAVLLRRPVFVIFGALGVSVYLGHLAYQVFQDSIFFPVILSLIGLAIIYFGIHYQRERAKFEKLVRDRIGPRARSLIPARALTD